MCGTCLEANEPLVRRQTFSISSILQTAPTKIQMRREWENDSSRYYQKWKERERERENEHRYVCAMLFCCVLSFYFDRFNVHV